MINRLAELLKILTEAIIKLWYVLHLNKDDTYLNNNNLFI